MALLVGCGGPSAEVQPHTREILASAALYTAFSTEMVADDGPCPVIKCACRAQDDIGSLLCPNKPAANNWSACDDINGYSGADNQSCTGFGLRGDNYQWKSLSGKLEGCGVWSGPSDGPTCAQTAEHSFKCAVKKCDEMELSEPQYDQLVGMKSSSKRCSKLGEMKHSCVEEELDDDPQLRSERSYDMSQKPPKVVKDQGGNETVGYDAADAAKEQQGLKGPLRRPDAVFGSSGPMQVYDAKFPCPQNVKDHDMFSKSYPSDSPTTGASMMKPHQRNAYKKIADQGQKGKGSVQAVSPHDARNEQCD